MAVRDSTRSAPAPSARDAVVSQSGPIAEALVCAGPRIGFRAVISCGGEMARDAADLIAFLAADPGTRAIGLFLETVRRPAAFATALETCAIAGKPVVCLNVGSSQAGARAALAHTGVLVGSDRALGAVLRLERPAGGNRCHRAPAGRAAAARRRPRDTGAGRGLRPDAGRPAAAGRRPAGTGRAAGPAGACGGALPEHESALILEAYGVPVTPHRRAATPEQAVRLGGSVIVARQVAAGPECLCGLHRDERHGPVLAVGRGGDGVESTRPVLCLAPVDRKTVRDLVREAQLPNEAPALADVLVALGRLACEHPRVAVVDINPLILGPGGAVAVDALVEIGAAR